MASPTTAVQSFFRDNAKSSSSVFHMPLLRPFSPTPRDPSIFGSYGGRPGDHIIRPTYFLPEPIAPWMMFPRTPESVPSGRTALLTLEANSLFTRKDA